MLNALKLRLARWIAPAVWDELRQPLTEELTAIVYRATDTQLALDTLADHLGYTVVVDGETGLAEIIKN